MLGFVIRLFRKVSVAETLWVTGAASGAAGMLPYRRGYTPLRDLTHRAESDTL